MGKALTATIVLRIDDQRRDTGRIPLAVGRIVEGDIVGVGTGPRAARF